MPGEDGLGGHAWYPRPEYLLRLADREDVEDPLLHALREYREKDHRRREILATEYSDAAKDVLRAEQRYAEAIATAEGLDRGPRQRAFDSRTEEMQEAEKRLPELQARLLEAGDRMEALEREYRKLVRWIDQNFLPAAARDVEIPALPDQNGEIERHGSRPGPSALDRTAVRMGLG